jgi:8-oxo-dGTP pyrophosphatase MutT (NUDIX family)
MKALSADAAAAVVPRAAATTLVVRDGASGLEVLMVRRSAQATFMPGAHVFPGGAVDAADASAVNASACDESSDELAQRIGAVTGVGGQALAYAVAALRECFEECGLWLGAPKPVSQDELDASRRRLHGGETLGALAVAANLPLATRVLQPWSHWVTPLGLPKRFDTLFFVVLAPMGQVPQVDSGETTTLDWVVPSAALTAHAQGAFPMEFATVRTVESLRPFERSVDLLAHAAAQRHLPPLHPRLQCDAEGRILAVVLPGQPGYEQAGLPPRPA